MMEENLNSYRAGEHVGSESGYLEHAVEPLSADFTQVEVLHHGQVTVLARAVRYGRKYFLKALSADAAGQLTYRQMLRKEFELLMRLSHRGVVQAVDMTTIEPLGQCIVMEWVEGVTLDKWLDEHTNRNEARDIVMQLLDAVEHIHYCGIVHRDLKPANVMVTHNGDRAVVIDFGLADTDAHTALKQPAGTAGYMAPEQLSDRVADARNDVYSLGVMLRQMNVGASWKRIAQRCLRSIDERYQSVEALRDALQAVERRKRWGVRIATALVAGGIVAGSAVIAHNLSSDNARLHAESDSLRTALTAIDSLQMQQHTSIAGQQQRIVALADSLASTNAAGEALQQSQREQHEHEQRLAQAAERGRQVIDNVIRQEHLDGFAQQVNDMEMVNEYFKKWLNVQNAISPYLEHLDSHFTPQDRSNIQNQLINYLRTKRKTPDDIVSQKIQTGFTAP